MRSRMKKGKFRPLFMAIVLGCVAGLTVSAAPAPDTDPAEYLKKARVDGKYQMLVHQIKVEKDQEKLGDFKDFGHRSMKEYDGHKDLTPGWWVYVAPYWYIWRDKTAKTEEKRPWGPEQAIGEPDTPIAGDCQTAWASKTPDGDDEWLLLEYAEPAIPTLISVHESFNTGALIRVTVFKLDGTEVEVWKGVDPTAPNSGMGVSEIPVKVDFKTNRVKLYLDSKNVAGWNEIDAVGFTDDAKNKKWAIAAEASSTFAPDRPAEEDTPDDPKKEKK
jgi:hypothetical protein